MSFMDKSGAMVVNITPALAIDYLRKNTINRPLSKKRVRQLADDMKHGRWRYTGDAIKFDESGTLLDGQHRLSAVVQSGKAIQSLVVTGLETKVFEVLDRGKRRSNRDVLAAKGCRHYGEQAAALKLLNGIYSGKDHGVTIPPTQLDRYLARFPRLGDVAGFAYKSKAYNVVRSKKLVVAVIMMSVDTPEFNKGEYPDIPDSVQWFWRSLGSGLNLSASDPAYVLREKLQNNRIKASRGAELDRIKLACIIKAWNAYAGGRLIRSLPNSLRPDEKIPTTMKAVELL